MLLALVACGGGNEGSAGQEPPAASATQATEPSPEDDLERAFRAYTQAFLTGDAATAYALLSERCRAETPLSGFAEASEMAAELYGEVDYTIETVEVSGDRGTVDATSAVEALNSKGGSAWVLEDGEWHTDKCGD